LKSKRGCKAEMKTTKKKEMNWGDAVGRDQTHNRDLAKE
jgi:hypothetical protein